jgi:hypothetical protein
MQAGSAQPVADPLISMTTIARPRIAHERI